MEEKELKTSVKQRIIIGAIAVVMVGSIIAGYIAIVLSGNSSSSNRIDQAKIAQYQQEYEDAQRQFTEQTKADYEKFIQFKPEVTAYNEEAANAAALQTEDLLVGEGHELADGDDDYAAYYIGWCADETVFDSSLDSPTTPTGFKSVLDVSSLNGGLIEGWNTGVIGMKLGGVREITIPGELAYKDTREICGGTYKPLKFIVMAVENSERLQSLLDDISIANTKVQYAAMGIDYDALLQDVETSEMVETDTGESSDPESGGEDTASQ